MRNYRILIDYKTNKLKTGKWKEKYLHYYGNEIQKKPEIIVINKCDIMEKEDIDKKLKSLKTLKSKEILLISAYTGEVIDKLKTSILKVMETENQDNESGSKHKWQP